MSYASTVLRAWIACNFFMANLAAGCAINVSTQNAMKKLRGQS